MKTLAKNWEEFNEKVIPRNAPNIQRTEMKKAFYAGATAIMGELIAIGDSDMGENLAIGHLESLSQEAETFFKEM